MAVNQAHANGGVLLHAGEMIMIYVDGVDLKTKAQDSVFPKSSLRGRLYLTTHRVIFTSKKQSSALQSLTFPFNLMQNIELEQPIFGANYIKGLLLPLSSGGFMEEIKFELHFMHGGAIELGRAMMQAAKMAARAPAPAYQAPQQSGWYQPQSFYMQPQQQPGVGFEAFQQAQNVYPNQPPKDQVWVTDAPPPYSSIFGSGAGQTAYYNPQDPNTTYVQPNGYGAVPQAPPAYEDVQEKKKN